MKVLLTGITGNLGSQIGHILQNNGHEIIPVVRFTGKDCRNRFLEVGFDPGSFSEILEADLNQTMPAASIDDLDAIVHCAGIVHFNKAKNINQVLAENIVQFAKRNEVPIYHISTAYVHDPEHGVPENQYSFDKHNAEKVVINSEIPYAIFRPSILTGHSVTGEIVHFGGYYLVAQAFQNALRHSPSVVKFPELNGFTNIIPVDLVARTIVSGIEDEVRGTFYLTNPEPPTFNWLLHTTLKNLNLFNKVEIINCTIEQFANKKLSYFEKKLFEGCKPFYPYWSVDYVFPESVCHQVNINGDYMQKILKYFKDNEND